jgi:dynein heavy chain, axonemal
LEEGYCYFGSDQYTTPPRQANYEQVLAHIRALPETTQPGVFGLHANADILKDMHETDQMLESLISMQGCGRGAALISDQDQLLEDLTVDIIHRMQPLFDVEHAR